MNHQYFDDPNHQRLFDEGHPFFVEWAKTKTRPRKELAIALAHEITNRKLERERHQKMLASFESLVQQFEARGEDMSIYRAKLDQHKKQRHDALAKGTVDRKIAADQRHANWQRWADEVWKLNPRWNKKGVAMQIIEDHFINAAIGTVADILVKPKSDRPPVVG